eukprot:13968950-Alexandrium_andersonii.AAC.1
MSASLVGSEMCIRDRLTPHDKRPELELPSMHMCVRRSKLEMRGPGRGPVSYTHLTLPTICSV